ncbi:MULTISPECIES: arylesterase [Pseudomonas]|uniref:Arylesterase n=1 Tax=Pseudomonas quercus TaxID=2722792 RepID=A0ABX0YE34_9PSED|nr:MULTISPECIES: arylesterase [Pseudomonas]MBF7143291.1 arylesterase [Pseudomonas sp. LY10J]NJP01595.1 arylesterase [Pseudomonas quercus]
MRMWKVAAVLWAVCLAQGAVAGTVLVLGDSISAGFGLDTSKGWVALLQQRLRDEGYTDRVVNASITGDTSANGRARLEPLLAANTPDLVVLELGGNDGLRGQPPAQLQQNLSWIVDKARQSGARVLLLGVPLPPNYGAAYINAFTGVYKQVALDKQIPLVTSFLEGVGGVPELMQADGIHPRVEAQPRLLENVWPTLKPLL